MKTFQSWGLTPKHNPAKAHQNDWRYQSLPIDNSTSLLPFGNGRSYGDVCQNSNADLLNTQTLNRFIAFDKDAGLITVESGVLLDEILNITVGENWFLPVLPGTRFVTVGGAIANDIHGKNHDQKGCFGNHISKLELLRSDGKRLVCSPTENTDLFHATIGGLGLTGLIVWAEIRLMPIAGDAIESQQSAFNNIEEFIQLNTDANDWEYRVAWIDCMAKGKNLGRGIFTKARHSNKKLSQATTKLSMPVTPAFSLVNTLTLKLFNGLYFAVNAKKTKRMHSHYNSFFFPLDSIKNWNRIYGKNGFYQYQCVVPNKGAITELLMVISESNSGSFLAVLKSFGDILPLGLLSFPKQGFTLALDFPNNGSKTLSLLEKLDDIVKSAGGAVYPAKDARMSGDSFSTYYPRVQEYEQYIDPKFSSTFWRRITNA